MSFVTSCSEFGDKEVVGATSTCACTSFLPAAEVEVVVACIDFIAGIPVVALISVMPGVAEVDVLSATRLAFIVFTVSSSVDFIDVGAFFSTFFFGRALWTVAFLAIFAFIAFIAFIALCIENSFNWDWAKTPADEHEDDYLR